MNEQQLKSYNQETTITINKNEKKWTDPYLSFVMTLFFLLSIASNKRAVKTITVPRAWRFVNVLPNRITEPSIVKSFLVVVTIEHVNGPNVVTVLKIKYWKKKVLEYQAKKGSKISKIKKCKVNGIE